MSNVVSPLAIVSSAFDPPDGQEPYSIVFDLTGDIAHDRPEKVGPSPVFVPAVGVRYLANLMFSSRSKLTILVTWRV